MASAVLKAGKKPRTAQHPARSVIATSLAFGLAVALVSYLAAALMLPGPAERAGTEELEARGAQIWIEFCAESAYEPRFWPECTQSTPEWRVRGAERLIQFCTESVPSRMFRPDDCLAADRPFAGLSGPPRAQDLGLGVIGAGVTALILGGLAWYRGRRPAG
jgi:hypothetical protein